mmetsp:Transcript_24058/g.59678  ORF Transcript_24058/g.59678 Transcript_24058/m.59678 type:complete len:234 (+) Transcript_24058:40-741(+)
MELAARSIMCSSCTWACDRESPLIAAAAADARRPSRAAVIMSGCIAATAAPCRNKSDTLVSSALEVATAVRRLSLAAAILSGRNATAAAADAAQSRAAAGLPVSLLPTTMSLPPYGAASTRFRLAKPLSGSMPPRTSPALSLVAAAAAAAAATTATSTWSLWLWSCPSSSIFSSSGKLHRVAGLDAGDGDGIRARTLLRPSLIVSQYSRPYAVRSSSPGATSSTATWNMKGKS